MSKIVAFINQKGGIKTMNSEKFKDMTDSLFDILGEFGDRYERDNPEWRMITFFQILHGAVENLRNLIENPEKKNITWENPFIELAYPVQASWDKLEIHSFTLAAADREDLAKLRATFAKGFISIREVCVLEKLTRGILLIIKDGKRDYKLPPDLNKKLAKLSKEKRTCRIEKILKPITKFNHFCFYERSGKKPGGIYLIWRFDPGVLNVDEGRAYHPIVIGLEFRGIKPEDIDEETRAASWKSLLKVIERAIPKENLDFLEGPRPEPAARPVTKEALLVKAGLHAELQKFGHRPDPGLFDNLLDDTKKEITERSIEVVGINITRAQNQAFFAIQKLLDARDYKGNIGGRKIKEMGRGSFEFTGYLPALEFTPAQYLEAYGLTKKKSARGWEEYSGEERRDALRALIDLAKTPFLLVYKQKYPVIEKGKREEKINRIETIAYLFKIIRGWEALTKYEDRTLDRGQSTVATDEKLKAIAIEPAPIFIQDIHTFYVLKSANYLQEINLLYPWPNKPSKFAHRFIEWLITQAELKRRNKKPLVINENFIEIAYHLRMDAYIRTNQKKRIREIINKCYQAAKDLGYLLSYGTVQGETKDLERLELNPEKFSRVREIKEERKRLENMGPDH